MSQSPIAHMQLSRARLGTKRKSAKLKPHSNPVHLNKRLPNPGEQKSLRDDLRKAQEAALAQDTSGIVGQYGSSTLLTALEANSSDSNSDASDHDAAEDSDSDLDDTCSSAVQVPTVTLPARNVDSPDDFYKTPVVVDCAGAEKIKAATIEQQGCSAWFQERH